VDRLALADERAIEHGVEDLLLRAVAIGQVEVVGRMPSPQAVSVKLKSSALRAETISGEACLLAARIGFGLGQAGGDAEPARGRWCPWRAIWPVQLSVMRTSALPTPLPLSSAVTQTSDWSRPHLKWTLILVTSAPAAT
jgi:hypothetical protein